MKTSKKWQFWTLMAIVLLLGWQRIIADPNSPAPVSASPVVITEFMAANTTGLRDEDGDFSDWIELYNRSHAAVNLEGWSLTDDPGAPDKWTFRDTSMPGQSHLVVFASGKNRNQIEPQENRPYLHTNFLLSSEPGFLALYPPTLRMYLDASEYQYPQQFSDVAYGRVDPQRTQGYYLEQATPNAVNDVTRTWADHLPPVRFSHSPGYYEEAFALRLENDDSEAVIRYTLDGSEPSADNGLVYSTPIPIESTTVVRATAFRDNHLHSQVATRSFLFVADILAQEAQPAGFPATWGTHPIDIGPYRAGTAVEADYAMDVRIVEDEEYRDDLIAGLHALPTMMLTLAVDDWDIYATPQSRGPEFERPVSVEWIEADGNGFQINAGIRIQGGAGRWEFMPKHSFRLFFKQLYGAAKLHYPLFPSSRVTEFDTVVLRAGVDRSFAGHPSTEQEEVDHRQATYLRDEWLRSSQIAMSQVGSHGRFVHLYLNGLYWGLYNLVERPDASFAASYLGGDKDEWFSANHGGAVGGLPDRFHVLMQVAQEGGLADPERYSVMTEFVDPEQFSDYMIVNWYAGNRDWPENNWYVDVRNPAGKNYFFVWDAELTWEQGASIVLGSDGWEGAPYPNVVKLLFLSLMENADFRMTFADRLYTHLYNDGALTDANAQVRWRALAQEIETAIIAESARWGDVRYDEPITRADWMRASADVLAQMEGNAEQLIRLARAEDYYPPIDPPLFAPAASEFDDELAVTMELGDIALEDGETEEVEASDATIYYTVDGTDPRQAVTGVVAETARVYERPLHLDTTTTVQARVLADNVWSAMHSVTYRHRDEQQSITITELMVNPAESGDNEFVELKNTGEVVVDLSGCFFEGIDYRFPKGVRLAPGEFLVLVRDFGDFRDQHPEARVDGVFGGRLANEGETITLRRPNGDVLLSVTYGAGQGWPLSAGGAGDSLVLIDTDGDPNQAGNWRASTDLYGSPGRDDPAR